jgi:hypothetical protein
MRDEETKVKLCNKQVIEMTVYEPVLSILLRYYI